MCKSIPTCKSHLCCAWAPLLENCPSFVGRDSPILMQQQRPGCSVAAMACPCHALCLYCPSHFSLIPLLCSQFVCVCAQLLECHRSTKRALGAVEFVIYPTRVLACLESSLKGKLLQKLLVAFVPCSPAAVLPRQG